MRRAPSIVLVLLVIAARASAQPAPAPAPPAQPAAPPQGGQTPQVPNPQAAPAPQPQSADGPAPTPPPASGDAPPGYFVDGPVPPGAEAPPPPPVYEPPPPGFGAVFEPPPPPVARHVAPNTALWLGVRTGWFLPFGYVYAESIGGAYGAFQRIPWDWYAGSGLMIEGDVGVRLGRNYTLFALWERAQLSSGDHYDDIYGGQSGADSDFWGIGFQASSDADAIGFLTEIALGYRQARTTWEDGTEMRFTDAWLESRIGFGADIRLSPLLSVQPMATLGIGSFGDIDRVRPDDTSASVVHAADAADSHAWFTIGVGGHVDLFGNK